MKNVQKFREKPIGIDVVGLALGENIASDIIRVRFIISSESGKYY